MRGGGQHRFRRFAPETFDDAVVGGAYRIVEFRIVRGDAARHAVFPQRIQRIERGLTVCLAQVKAQTLCLAPTPNFPKGIVDIDIEFLAKELCECQIGEIEYLPAVHAEHSVDDRYVHGTDLGI